MIHKLALATVILAIATVGSSGLLMDYAQAVTKNPNPCFIVASVADKIVKIDTKVDTMTTKTLTNAETALKLTSQANKVSKENVELGTVKIADAQDLDQLRKELGILANESKDLIAAAQNYPNPDGDLLVENAKTLLRDEAKATNAMTWDLIDQIPI